MPRSRDDADMEERGVDSWKPVPEQDPDPSLRDLGIEEAKAAVAPEVQAMAEARFAELDKSKVSHVVIQLTTTRQRDILRHGGYRYDWDTPGPAWLFLGKIAAKGLFDDDGATVLEELNFVPMGRREFIAYTTPMWRRAAAAAIAAGQAVETSNGRGVRVASGTLDGVLPPLNVLEVAFKKPQPGQPLVMTWGPARDMIAARIKLWTEESDGEEEAMDMDE